MKTETLVVPEDLAQGIKEVAELNGLSIAEALRQTIRLGLPKIGSPRHEAKPLTSAEARIAFGPDPEWDPLEAAMARIPIKPEQE